MKEKKDVHERKQALIDLTSGFCNRYLDNEYRRLCEKLINKMARKRNVPFLSGKLELWAAAVVHALGSINFLFDKSFPPYASMDDICGYFKTSRSSTTQKSKLIRDMFNLWYYDPELSTTHVAKNNPLAGLVVVDDLILALKTLKPENEPVFIKREQNQPKLVKDRTENEKETIYIMKVTLRDCTPPIWRRFQVPGSINLYKLHRVLQVVMGWENYHLYQFIIKNTYYGDPDPDPEHGLKNARKTRLDQVVTRAKTSFTYEYDFGDGWNHSIQVEKILPAKEKIKPLCLAGERACPPEDCGGPWGYENLLEILSNPEHDEYDETLAWVREDFDPEFFDLDELNKELKKLR
ncbi:MAG: plasmid pRiA4b ORF-3 family protein [Peptococcaceae bacterium]|nr:plasmid pRiA4b ORF-3 family protein [Peptococcaceae bacterium]